MDNEQRAEWQAWQDVVAALKVSGAVTEADCASPAGSKETPGQRLFETIKDWALAYHELATLSESQKGGDR